MDKPKKRSSEVRARGAEVARWRQKIGREGWRSVLGEKMGEIATMGTRKAEDLPRLHLTWVWVSSSAGSTQ